MRKTLCASTHLNWEIRDDEILVKIISDSICLSSYKAAIQEAHHKRVPDDVPITPRSSAMNSAAPSNRSAQSGRTSSRPADSSLARHHYLCTQMTPGYAFEYCGGDSQYAILIPEIMEQNCLLEYRAKEYFYGSLSEPLSCIIGTFHAMYHTKPGVYTHEMGIREGGNMAILAGAGPMGLGAIDYAIHCDRRPGLLVVTDINQARLDRAASIYTVEDAARHGVRLVYLNTSGNAVEKLKKSPAARDMTTSSCSMPVPAVIEQGDAILGFDGCLNFFAGPTNPKLSANFNFYDVHYSAHHLVGTSGGNTDDMREALHMIAEGKLNPAGMITHVGGLNAVAETTLNLPSVPGGKKLIYTHIAMELTAIEDFARRAKPTRCSSASPKSARRTITSGVRPRPICWARAGNPDFTATLKGGNSMDVSSPFLQGCGSE